MYVTHMCTHIHTHGHTHMHADTHTHTHTHTHTYTHAHTQVLMVLAILDISDSLSVIASKIKLIKPLYKLALSIKT